MLSSKEQGAPNESLQSHGKQCEATKSGVCKQPITMRQPRAQSKDIHAENRQAINSKDKDNKSLHRRQNKFKRM